MWFFSSIFNIIMTEGKTLPILIKFALPLVAGNVFQLMYTFFDTAATIMVIFGKTILTVFVSPGDADGAQAALWFFRFFIGANGILYAEVLAWIGADLVLIPYFIYTFKKMK